MTKPSNDHDTEVRQAAPLWWHATCSCGWVELARTESNAQQMADTHVFREQRA